MRHADESQDAYIISKRKLLSRMLPSLGSYNERALYREGNQYLDIIKQLADRIQELRCRLDDGPPKFQIDFSCGHSEIMDVTTAKRLNGFSRCSLCADQDGLFRLVANS